MSETRLAMAESRFADIIWSAEPITSSELVKRCEQEFVWKRTTTYTVLKRLCERGIFELKDSTVTSLISRDEFYAKLSEECVDESFDGSLPAFFAAFTSRRKISEKEINEIRKMIDSFEADSHKKHD
ncbi:MAG: BlaI/MecI/CopY family transcriptional regulator [Lachnospiraceae bacterium]|nr:BlaI/MecI/CopY family transcriptional regulator [Lachnospiraceae bacterium]